jgi:hypothetical protein
MLQMAPKWFSVDNIPYESMWLDDSIWLKHFLAGKKFRGQFLFANDSEITSWTLNEVESV